VEPTRDIILPLLLYNLGKAERIIKCLVELVAFNSINLGRRLGK
jgi:hypothetical protein